MATFSPITVARFWSKVRVGREADCWPWSAATDRYGYGQFKGSNGVTPKRAHRVAYELVNGEPKPGLVIRHACNNPACCNPTHLLEGTQADNHEDRDQAGRCPRDAGRFAAVDAVTGNRTLDLLITNEVLYR